MTLRSSHASTSLVAGGYHGLCPPRSDSSRDITRITLTPSDSHQYRRDDSLFRTNSIVSASFMPSLYVASQ